MNARERQRVLRLMLALYIDCRQESGERAGSGTRRESRLLAFDPRSWTPQMRELERCLDLLRDRARARGPMLERGVTAGSGWWHLRQRYLEATTVRRELRTRKTRSGHRVPVVPAHAEVLSAPTSALGGRCSVLLRIWHAGVDERVVDAAVRWISGEYRGEPALPLEETV